MLIYNVKIHVFFLLLTRFIISRISLVGYMINKMPLLPHQSGLPNFDKVWLMQQDAPGQVN